MNKLSMLKLAETLQQKRKQKGLTQENLSNLTGINQEIIGRIENKNYTPSIIQLEALANVLDFEITDLLIDKQETNSFVALRSETLSDSEKEGVEKIFTMMLSLRQQIMLRSKFENESLNRS